MESFTHQISQSKKIVNTLHVPGTENKYKEKSNRYYPLRNLDKPTRSKIAIFNYNKVKDVNME